MIDTLSTATVNENGTITGVDLTGEMATFSYYYIGIGCATILTGTA